MCGIFGIISSDIRRKQIEVATATLSHRGPNDSGFFFAEGVGFGHQRLSIIDLEGGQQPIFNEDRSKCVIFNGEIYNFLELRDQLIKKGHRFSTKSDTETILHAYEEWGEACVEYLRGMFAFAIWDEKEKRLFLARDRLGIKPLFYAEYMGRFYFASEMKSILTEKAFPRDMDELALTSYFVYSYIPAPLTIFTQIRKLLPGHTLTRKNGKTRIRKYWDLYFVPDRDKDEHDFIHEFMDLLQESVEIRLMSEVPLGAFLSGGIDSSTVVALMSGGSTTPVNTFCIGFGGEIGGYLDERRYARMVAEQYATNHKEYEVLPKPEGLVEKIVRAFDEPFADDSTIPSYFVCKTARENVTVALSGLGGDEAFAGYERYLGFKLRRIYNRFLPLFGEKAIRNFVDKLPERSNGHYTVNHMKRFVRSASLNSDLSYLGYLSHLRPDARESFFSDSGRFKRYLESCDDLVLDYFNSSNVLDGRDSLNRAFYCDIKTYLPDDILAVTDRMSMHHSLEVRVPFLDHRLLEFCSTIPPEMKMKWFRKKYLLRRAVASLLPWEVISHRKQGFVGPMAQWLKNDLKPYVLESLSEEKLKKHGLLNHGAIKTILHEHFSGREIHDTLIWSILIFQTWFNLYIEKSLGVERELRS
jgi:asparagine synthase (glutamine-hydrolysing)